MWSEEESWGGEKIWFFLTRKCKFLQMVTLVAEGFCKDNNVHAKDDNPRSSYQIANLVRFVFRAFSVRELQSFVIFFAALA